MIEMGLDPRLKDAILQFISNKHPELVSQEEIYIYLENNIEFTEKQKRLHIQKAGQIEPNWQHDARNIIHSLKKSNVIICPKSETFGLPLNDILEQEYHDKKWQEIEKFFHSNYNLGHINIEFKDKEIKVRLKGDDSSKTITSKLLQERVNHLAQCGYKLKKSSFHKWSLLAESMAILHPDIHIEIIDNLEFVILKPGGVECDDNAKKIDRANLVRGRHRNRSKTKKRTVPREKAGAVFMSQNNSDDVKYSVVALNPNQDLSSPDLIRIADCPPANRGGPARIYCPICGQRFVSSGNQNKIWFQHYGERGSHRKEFLEWPEHSAKASWDEVSNRRTGWWYNKIHHALGYGDYSILSPSQVMSVERKKRIQAFSMQLIPVRLHFHRGQWTAYAVAPHGQDGAADFEIKGAEKLIGPTETWYKINDFNLPAVMISNGHEEEISWPIDTQNALIIIQEGHDVGQGTLSHPRFKSSDINSGNYFRQREEGSLEVANTRFSQFSAYENTKFEIALPTIKETIPWLDNSHIVPIHISGDVATDLTLINPIIEDIEPWHLQGDVYLNTSHFREGNQNLRPAIELRQTDAGSIIHRSTINLYPAFKVPEIRPSFISIDGKEYPPRSACIVDNIPKQIEFLTGDGLNHQLNEMKCLVMYAFEDDGKTSWYRFEDSLGNSLAKLGGLELPVLGFSISIISNSRRDLFDWIQITKVPKSPNMRHRIYTDKQYTPVNVPVEIKVDESTYKLDRRLKRRLDRGGLWRPMDESVHGLTQDAYVRLQNIYLKEFRSTLPKITTKYVPQDDILSNVEE